MPERRHAGELRWGPWGLVAAVAIPVLWSFWVVGLPERAGHPEAWREAFGFLAGFVPPRSDAAFLAGLVRPTLDTLAMAVVGTVTALLIAVPLAAFASRTVLGGARLLTDGLRLGWLARGVHALARTTAVLLASVPEVIWAVILVRVIGLGPAAGALALGLAYGGVIAKVWSEQIEALDSAPSAALEANGAGRFQVLLFSILPRMAPTCAAYAAYRFECALRASAIMGFVGAGGLGFRIEEAAGYSRYDELAACVIALIALVALVEWAAEILRRRLA
jgi:phosphonate transport system permease protein